MKMGLFFLEKFRLFNKRSLMLRENTDTFAPQTKIKKMTTKKMILGLLLCSSVGFAQVKMGVKAGANIASLPGDYPSFVDNEAIFGFHAGVTADLKLSAKSSLVAEALVSTQGGKSTQNASAYETVKQTIKLTNINIPVLYRYKIIEKLSVEAGPQVGFVISGKNEVAYTNGIDPSQNETIELDALNGGTFVSDGTTYSYEKGIRSVDFSVNLGVTYSVVKNFFVQARYNRGLTAVDLRSTVGSATKSLNTMNSVFQVSVGYNFN
jgi:hypothetical protein